LLENCEDFMPFCPAMLGSLWSKFWDNCVCNCSKNTIIVGGAVSQEVQAELAQIISQSAGLQEAVLAAKAQPAALVRTASVQQLNPDDGVSDNQQGAAGIIGVVTGLMDQFADGTHEQKLAKVAAAAAQVGVDLIQRYHHRGTLKTDEERKIREQVDSAKRFEVTAEELWRRLKRDEPKKRADLERINQGVKTVSSKQLDIIADGLELEGYGAFWAKDSFDELDPKIQRLFLDAAKAGAAAKGSDQPKVQLRVDRVGDDDVCELQPHGYLRELGRATDADLAAKRLELIRVILDLDPGPAWQDLPVATGDKVKRHIAQLKQYDGAIYQLFSALHHTADPVKLKLQYNFTDGMIEALREPIKKNRELVAKIPNYRGIMDLPIESLQWLYSVSLALPDEKREEFAALNPLSKWLSISGNLPGSPPQVAPVVIHPDGDNPQGGDDAEHRADQVLHEMRQATPPEVDGIVDLGVI
jgi:hypothetical protein